MNKKRKYKYMHTIYGHPANYRNQICCGSQYIRLVDDLKTIKLQQELSNSWRMKKGFCDSSFNYSYKKVIV